MKNNTFFAQKITINCSAAAIYRSPILKLLLNDCKKPIFLPSLRKKLSLKLFLTKVDRE